MASPADYVSLPEPVSRSWTFARIGGVGGVVLVLAAAVLFAWRPWEERVFAAGEVPAACADLAAVKAVVFPGQPFGGEEHFDRPGVWRDDFEGGPGTALACMWMKDEMALDLHIEYWADGPEAASDAVARTRAGWPDEWLAGPALDVGDEGAAARTNEISVHALARVGNVAVRVFAFPPGEVTDFDVVRVLEGLVAVVGA